MNRDALAWLRWVLIPNLGLKRSQALLNLIDSPDCLFLRPERLPLPESVKATIRDMNVLGEQHPIHRQALAQLDWAQQDHHWLIFPGDDLYPNQLTVIDDAPMVLWTVGKAELLSSRQIAMVGSRHASPAALRQAKAIATDLGAAGLTITSGGALGIDGACHRAALDHAAPTIAVLGCGVDVCYPKQHRQLFSDMTARGLRLSEYPLGTQPRPGHFPRRNRLISALSDIVVVLEAAQQSGTLITAEHALEQGKDIFAMPGDITNPNTAGCHQLIQEGAYLLTGAHDILQHLQLRPAQKALATTLDLEAFTPLQQQIIRQLQFGAAPLDALGHELGLRVHQLLEPILELELEGIIEQQPGGYVLAEIA